jgi:hypothetical protein
MTLNKIFWAISHLDIFANLILKLRNFANFTCGGPLERKVSREDPNIKHLLLGSGVKNKRRKGQKIFVGDIR